MPAEVKNALNDLRYNRLITVLIGLDAPPKNDLTALYSPSMQVLPHRIGFQASFSVTCVPEGKSSILAEITCPVDQSEIWDSPNGEIINLVVKQLCDLGLIGTPKEVCFQALKRSPYAYVIYDLNHKKNMQVISKYFEEFGISLLGRFSRFEYLNMDACIRDAMTKADELNRKI